MAFRAWRQLSDQCCRSRERARPAGLVAPERCRSKMGQAVCAGPLRVPGWGFAALELNHGAGLGDRCHHPGRTGGRASTCAPGCGALGRFSLCLFCGFVCGANNVPLMKLIFCEPLMGSQMQQLKKHTPPPFSKHLLLPTASYLLFTWLFSFFLLPKCKLHLDKDVPSSSPGCWEIPTT